MAPNGSPCQKRSLSTEEVIECIFAENDTERDRFSLDSLTESSFEVEAENIAVTPCEFPEEKEPLEQEVVC